LYYEKAGKERPKRNKTKDKENNRTENLVLVVLKLQNLIFERKHIKTETCATRPPRPSFVFRLIYLFEKRYFFAVCSVNVRKEVKVLFILTSFKAH
jgi:hypothetical protein